MMSRRSRAGDRPLAYPPHLFFCFFVVFVFIVLAAETAIMVQRTCIYFHFPCYRSQSGNGVSESFPRWSQRCIICTLCTYIHVHTYIYLPQVIFYVLVRYSTSTTLQHQNPLPASSHVNPSKRWAPVTSDGGKIVFSIGSAATV